MGNVDGAESIVPRVGSSNVLNAVEIGADVHQTASIFSAFQPQMRFSK